MAWQFVSSQTNVDTATGNSIGSASAISCAAATTIFLAVGVDNLSASTPTVSTISKPAGETNSWTKLGIIDSPTATAAGGVRAELWAIQTATAWTSHGITVTFSSASTVKKTLAISVFTGGTLTSTDAAFPKTGSNLAGTGTITHTLTNVDSADLVMGVVVSETNSAISIDSDTTNGSWADAGSVVSTGGGSAANVSLSTQYKIVTASGNQTLNVPTSDGGELLVGLKPDANQTVSPGGIASAEAFGTATITVTGGTTTVSPTAIASGETFPSGGAGNPRVAMVVDDIAGPAPSANDIIMRDILVADGMTVTYLSELNAPPSDTSTYDVVVHTESGSSTGTAITAYPTMAVPLVFLETSWQLVRMATTGPATNPTSTTQYDIIDNAHAITTGKPDPLTWRTAASGNYGVAASELPSGATHLAAPAGNATFATLAVAESGATLTSGTAPARRVVSGLGVGSSPAAWTADANALFISMVRWAANVSSGGGVTVTQGASAVTVSPTAISSAEAIGTPVVTLQGATTLSPTGIASGEAFPGGGAPFGSSQLIPGDNVMPESIGYNAPIMDSNGNLYIVTESSLDLNPVGQQNQPRAMKSTDGGHTWTEIDAANRPGTDTGSIGDLESAWLTWSPTTKIATFTWQRSYVVWSGFRTSDHPTNPDTWVSNTRENIAAVTGAPQFASHTSPPDQSYEWIFYNNSTTNPVYRSRTSPGTYGTQTAIDTSGQHPVAWLGNGNVSHILYIKTNQLYYKTLTSGGTLSSTPVRVDTNGVSTTTPIAHIRPVPYMNSGTEIVTCLFVNSAKDLICVDITGGTPGSEVTVTTANVKTDDAAATGSQGAIMTATVDGTTVHAAWVDDATGDIMYATRPHGGSWTTPVQIFNSGASSVDYVYGSIQTYPSGRKVFAYIYSKDFTADVVPIYYNEELLSGGGGVTVTQGAAGTTVSPTAITSGEAVGAPTIGGTVTVTPTAIASAESVSNAVLSFVTTVSPTAVASAEAMGTPTITTTVSVSPTGIASGEAFGTSVVGGTVTVSPTGVATAEAFGTVSVTRVITVSPTGISSAENLGSPSISAAVTIGPTGIVTLEAFGTPAMTGGPTSVSPTGIPTAEAFGATLVSSGGAVVVPTGIVTAEVFGTLTVGGTVTVSPTGIVTAEVFGALTVVRVITVSPTGIASAEVLGAPSLVMFVTLSPAGIASAQAFGNPSLAGISTVSPAAIGSAEVFGTPSVNSLITVSPAGIASAQAFGNPALSMVTLISPNGIASLEAFGNLLVGMMTAVQPNGIASGEQFGYATVSGVGIGTPPFMGWGIPI